MKSTFKKNWTGIWAFFCLCFIPQAVWGQVQYRPESSLERHELSAGVSLSTDKWKKGLWDNLPTYALKYNFYFPEVGEFFPEVYKKIFIPGLSVGLHLFNRNSDYVTGGRLGETHSQLETGVLHYNYNFCERRPMAYHLGLVGKMAFFDRIQAFVDGGMARTPCLSKENAKGKTAWMYYLSHGVFLSFLLLDPSSIYALDQDYGINNMGLRFECLHYYRKKKADTHFRSLCGVGLQMSF